MADNKKYYYIRLKENFFDSDNIIIIESMKNGLAFSNILLKLYLKSLKQNGKLMVNNAIPYDTAMIAKITRHKEKIVKEALQVLTEYGLIEVLENGAIYMCDIQNYIGESSTEADRKREYERRIAEEKKAIKVGDFSEKSTPKIEIEKELKLEKECITSSEPDKPTQSPSGILLPLNDNTYYDVPIEKISIWEQAYKAVDVKQELQKMCAWLTSNPTKRKTKRGVDRFINTWLSKEQDRGGMYRTSTYQNESRQQDAETAERRRRAMEFDWPVREPGPGDPF